MCLSFVSEWLQLGSTLVISKTWSDEETKIKTNQECCFITSWYRRGIYFQVAVIQAELWKEETEDGHPKTDF